MLERISVVIPVLNDAVALGRLLEILSAMRGIHETIVVDGGSQDGVQSTVESFGVRLVDSETGRGMQLRKGASEAEGDILWFLHADAVPQEGCVELISRTLERPGVAAGAFRFRLAEPRRYGWILALGINLRTRWLHLPLGDQGLFFRTTIYKQLGGFRPLPILEDLDLVLRAREVGRIVLVKQSLGVSPRRWDREGFLRRLLRNWAILIRYAMGASPEDLAALYRPAPFSDLHPGDNLSK